MSQQQSRGKLKDFLIPCTDCWTSEYVLISLHHLEVYSFQGGGLLFELSKRAMITGNTAELDEAIRSKIRPYLYNEGAGKWIHCAHLACLRSPHTSHLTPYTSHSTSHRLF